MVPSDFVSRGQALVAAGQYQEAVKICRLGLLGKPTTVEGRTVLGQALLALRRYDEVLAEMRVALDLDDNCAAAYQLRGEALLRKGDAVAAIDCLGSAKQLAPGDPAVAALLAEAEIVRDGSAPGLFGGHAELGDSLTKHYPSHQTDDTGGPAGRTRPTSVARPPREPSPSRMELAVGDLSGTTEVDPEEDGVEMNDDFGDLAEPPIAAPAPPRGRQSSAPPPGRAPARRPLPPPAAVLAAKHTPTLSLDDDDVIELSGVNLIETPPPEAVDRARKRLSVGMPAGPLPEAQLPPRVSAAQLEIANRPTAIGDAVHDAPRSAASIGAPMAPWAKATMVAPGARDELAAAAPRLAPHARTMLPGPAVEPPPDASGFGNLLLHQTPEPSAPPMLEETGSARPLRGGVRAPRRLRVVLWVALGALVIVGGVVAGFQIRRVRLDRQIDAAITAAEADARPDTWLGWIKARNGFANIVQARDSDAARARVARARAVLAADFGDDVDGARAAVEALGPAGGGRDGAVARAYLALLGGDPEAAVAAAAVAEKATGDAVGHALVGRAALLASRLGEAVAALELAVTVDPRPAHLVALAEAELGARQLEEAKAACDQATQLVPDHPGALIMRARVLAASGALSTGSRGAEVTSELERVLAEGARAPAAQTVGVSTRQAADAGLALVAVQLARGDAQSARLAFDRATVSRPDDQRYAAAVVAALVRLGQYTQARAEVERALEKWPGSTALRRARAEIQLAEGDGAGALETLATVTGIAGAEGLTLRARAHLVRADLTAARADFEAALAASPDYEPAVVGRTWVDLRAGEGAQALARIQPLYADRAHEPSVASAYAAALRQTGARDKAREVLLAITAGPEGPDLPAAWLELGRLERDVGDYAAARRAYGKAIAGRGIEAKLEAALLYIDDADVAGGHETLEALAVDAPDDGRVLVETARARTLLGELEGARELLDRAAKLDSTPAGDLARERGRLAIKASRFKDAIEAFEAAIKTNDADFESHLLLLDAIGTVDNATKKATELLAPAKKRFGDKPERFLIMGKVALINGKTNEARAYFEQGRKELEMRRAPPRRIAEALFGLGRCAYIANDVATAIRFFDDGLRRDPTATDAWFALGDLAAGQGKLRRALDRYQNAARYNPEYPDLAYQVGRTAFELGEAQIAREALQRYLALAASGEYAAEARRMLSQLK